MSNNQIVEKMLMHIERIQNYVGNLSYAEFVVDDMVLDACVFNLSQLGEYANRIDDEFQRSHSNIPWRQVYGLRNRIVHDYDGINLILIWEIVHDDLPDLKQMLEELL